MGTLTTHVLDTAHGRPGAGIRVELYALDPGRHLVRSDRTNHDGRCDAPLLDEMAFRIGEWELVFHIGEYFITQKGLTLSDPPFLNHVAVRFGIATDTHYHVPLLVSPWGYTTYRGS
jgi:5-hydroxyisourate hydrolase